MSKHATSAPRGSPAADPRHGMRPRQDLAMEYVLMVLTIACILAGISQFVLAWLESTAVDPMLAVVQQGPARCVVPLQGILER